MSATDIEFRLSAADGYFTEGGSFNMLPSDQESVDAGTWIEVQPSVLVPAGEVRVVPFSLHVRRERCPETIPQESPHRCSARGRLPTERRSVSRAASDSV